MRVGTLVPVSAQPRAASWEYGESEWILSPPRIRNFFAPHFLGVPEAGSADSGTRLSEHLPEPGGLAVGLAASPQRLQLQSLGSTTILFYCLIPSQVELLFLHFLVFWRVGFRAGGSLQTGALLCVFRKQVLSPVPTLMVALTA